MIISASTDYRAAARQTAAVSVSLYRRRGLRGAYAEAQYRRSGRYCLAPARAAQYVRTQHGDHAVRRAAGDAGGAGAGGVDRHVRPPRRSAAARAAAKRHSVHAVHRVGLPDRRGGAGDRSADVVPALRVERSRLYAQCAGARQGRRRENAGVYRRYAGAGRPLPRRPLRDERP